MRFILIACCLILATAMPVAAQEIPVPQKQQGFDDLFTRTSEEIMQQKLQLERDAGDPAVAEKLVDRFYLNCLMSTGKKPVEVKVKEHICKCSAAALLKDMMPGEIITLFTKNRDSEVQRIRVFHDMVLPCMEQPVSYVTHNECLADNRSLKNPEKTCHCMAAKIGPFAVSRVRDYEYRENRTIEDLFHFLVDAPSLDLRKRHEMKNCTWKHEYGW